jgi:hypothetical protein
MPGQRRGLPLARFKRFLTYGQLLSVRSRFEKSVGKARGREGAKRTHRTGNSRCACRKTACSREKSRAPRRPAPASSSEPRADLSLLPWTYHPLINKPCIKSCRERERERDFPWDDEDRGSTGRRRQEYQGDEPKEGGRARSVGRRGVSRGRRASAGVNTGWQRCACTRTKRTVGSGSRRTSRPSASNSRSSRTSEQSSGYSPIIS